MTTLGTESFEVEGEGTGVRPGSDSVGLARRRGLQWLARDHAFEHRAATTRGLARDETHLDRAGGFDLDDAESIDRAEHRRKSEVAATLDDDGARGPGCRAHAVVEERQRRPWCTAHHRAGTTAFADPSRDFEGVDVVGVGEREWLTECRGSFASRVVVETSAHDQAGDADD